MSRAIQMPSVELLDRTAAGGLIFSVPAPYAAAVNELIAYQTRERRAPNRYFSLVLDTPKKPRTTGERSQNTHFNGHCREVAEELGIDLEHVRYKAKCVAMAMGYPEKRTPEGNVVLDLDDQVVPMPEREANTAEAAILIEAIHLIAAEMGIFLKEYDG